MNEKAQGDSAVQVKVGSSQQWKFTDILQVDAGKQKEMEMEFDGAKGDERPPFLVPLSERCAEKLKAKGVSIPAFLQPVQGSKEDAVAAEKEAKEIVRSHYDKEDLISFHQLFISKPLTKAAQDLEFEHPTVI